MAGNVAGGLAWLDPQDPVDAFPDPETALPEPDGLLAAGGDLKPERLLAALRAAHRSECEDHYEIQGLPGNHPSPPNETVDPFNRDRRAGVGRVAEKRRLF